MKHFALNLLNGLAWLAVIALIAASLAGLYVWREKGDRLLSVQTGSMVPTLQRGDAVAVQKTPAAELQAGDIVSYVSPINSSIVVTHRLIEVDWARGVAIIKGDALKAPDPPVPLNQILGRVRVGVPKLGFAIDALRRPAGLIIAVYLPAMIVVVLEIRRLAKSYGWGHYRLVNNR